VGRPRLPTEAIVEAALCIVDEDGVEALSMRALAQRLNASTATLYRHFPSRAALVLAVMDRLLGEIDFDSAELTSGSWQDAVRTFATEYFDALNRHPGAARMLADHAPVGPHAMALREIWLQTMLHNGFRMELAVRAGALVASYVQGFAIQLAGRRAAAGTDDEVISAAVGPTDVSEYPALAEAIRSGAAPVPLEDEFSFGLELILDGLDAARVRPSPGRRR